MATKKQLAARARFKAAFRKVKARGIKPFTKAFGAAMKKELKK